jgi:glycosyltransferase involved in cell wall biosynthesis
VATSIVPPAWVRLGRQPPVEVLHHGVDLSRIRRGGSARAAARLVLGIEEHVPVLGMVASFTERKDQGGLLVALDRVRRRVEDVVLLLIGSGPLEQEVRAAVAREHLEDHVRFLGSRPDVLELLAGLDVFVLNSRFEGLPISLLEAMASEVPVVATRVGGVPEALIDGEGGRLIEPGDPAALAAALTELLLDPVRRGSMGAAGARRVAADFEIGAAVARHQWIYEEVLK